MVIVEIIGGLGNQMFQYAFKMAYDAIHGGCALIDIGGFQSYKLRDFQLFVFNIENCVATPGQVAFCRNDRRVLRYKFPLKFWHETQGDIIYEKIENVYAPELLNKTGNAYFCGCFQTDKYFRHIRADVLRAFTLNTPLDSKNVDMLNRIRGCETPVSVHIRRGDYLGLQHIFGSVDKEYYLRAMNFIAAHVSNPHFFVFSDDVAWCRENIGGNYDISFVDINDGATCFFDLELMRNCRHNIIANSSFSWWGAWLNENPDKIVIAPKNWFADGRPTDIIPENWLKM